MDKAALILSIIAILVSIFEIYNNARLNKTNIKSEYFSQIYYDYLFNQIPDARKQIRIDNGRFIGFEKLQDAVTDMVSKSEFFKFANERFYNKLKKKCIDLEDFLLNTANKKNIQLSSPCNEVDKKIKKIYKYINRKREKG